MIYHWAITNMQGELEGEHSGIHMSSKDSFDFMTVPAGYMKMRLTYEEYDQLMLSFDNERGIYIKAIDPIPMDSAIRRLNERKSRSRGEDEAAEIPAEIIPRRETDNP